MAKSLTMKDLKYVDIDNAHGTGINIIVVFSEELCYNELDNKYRKGGVVCF